MPAPPYTSSTLETLTAMLLSSIFARSIVFTFVSRPYSGVRVTVPSSRSTSLRSSLLAASLSSSACDQTRMSKLRQAVASPRVSVAVRVTVRMPLAGSVTTPVAGSMMLLSELAHVMAEPFTAPAVGSAIVVAARMSEVSSVRAEASALSRRSSAVAMRTGLLSILYSLETVS